MIGNLANQKPPEYLEINGSVYPINYHYLTWIEIIGLLDEIDFEILYDAEAEKKEELEIIAEIEELAFGAVIPENIYDVLARISGFAAGYPKAKNDRAVQSGSSRRVVDFALDLNSILIAIRDQSGIDLIDHDGLFHWWRFLVEFENLTAEHHISKLMELRAYDGDNKELKRARDAVALPPKITRSDRRLEDDMAALFYSC